jgi:hypothetical protein
MLSVVATSAWWGREPFDFLFLFVIGSWAASKSPAADDGDVKIALKV